MLKLNANIVWVINFFPQRKDKNLLQKREHKHHKPDPMLLTFQKSSGSPPARPAHLLTAVPERLLPFARVRKSP